MVFCWWYVIYWQIHWWKIKKIDKIAYGIPSVVWKRITIHVTATVNSSKELKMVFCWWYVIYWQIHWWKIKKTDEIAYGIPSVVWKTSREKYCCKEEGSFFWRTLSVYKSISIFITNGLTDIQKIIDGSFFNVLFLFVNPSVKYLSTGYECKHRWNLS